MKHAYLIPPAEQELTESFSFYQSCAPNLGALFLDCFQSALQHVQRRPRAWPVLCADVRRKRFARFPYAIVYREYPDRIVVLAIMHLHRRPEYWTDRM
jgi:plasmid stabilization system protein ParE